MAASRGRAARNAPKGPGGRIHKEIALMESNPPPGCSASIIEDDIYHWVGCIDGPENSAYAGGKFPFKMEIPTKYPFLPPRIRFKTKIYHPNIQSTGEEKDGFGSLCIDILQNGNGWTPTLTIAGILVSVRSLFTDPNPDHPLEPDIAREYKTDREQFERTAKEYTQKYAMEN